MLPFEVEVDAGGAVSFIISGVHQILVYAGREMAELRAAWQAAGSPILPPVPPGLVDYAPDRVYRGLNPFALQYLPLAAPPPGYTKQSGGRPGRVGELQRAGTLPVVCGVRPHFIEGMHGYVDVKA